MKKYIVATIAALILVLAPSLALAKIGSRNLDEEQKVKTYCFGFQGNADDADGTTTDGVDGIIAFMSIENDPDPTHALVTTTATHAIMGLPYPGRISATMADFNAQASTGLTCATLAVEGIISDGTEKTEVLTTLTDTATDTTTNVYHVVTKLTAATCQEDSDYASGSGDGIRVFIEDSYVGLPIKINKVADIESACILDQSDSNQFQCATQDDGLTTDLASTVTLTAGQQVINMETVVFFDGDTGETAADGDLVCLRIRPSFY